MRPLAWPLGQLGSPPPRRAELDFARSSAAAAARKLAGKPHARRLVGSGRHSQIPLGKFARHVKWAPWAGQAWRPGARGPPAFVVRISFANPPSSAKARKYRGRERLAKLPVHPDRGRSDPARWGYVLRCERMRALNRAFSRAWRSATSLRAASADLGARARACEPDHIWQP